MHVIEVITYFRRWTGSDLAKKLHYARDRIVDVYLWACGVQPKPRYALSRIMIAKYTKMVSLADDTYDTYATLDELDAFTDAFERFANCNCISFYLILTHDLNRNILSKLKN